MIIDLQKDFCPGGALPVPEGDQVIPILNKYIKAFRRAGAQIYATRDWHPSDHISFQGQGGKWPPHCIQESEGAKFHPDLELPENVKIISKATTPQQESYSGFGETDLKYELKRNGIKRVFVGGLATDYCVKNTVLDALDLGFKTILLKDAIRGIDMEHGDSERAIQEMLDKGAKTTTSPDLQ